MTELDKSNFIFVLDREDWSYKGVLFAEVDVNDLIISIIGPAPIGYVAGFLLIIWTDENGEWQAKFRVKFPSGGKMSGEREFGKDSNETKILSTIYKYIPLIHKKWYPNKDGTIKGMLKILEQSNMIQDMQTFTMDNDS